MSSSDSESSDVSSSQSETNFDECGQFGYILEPEYTEEELQQIEAEETSRQQDIINNPRKFDTNWCSCKNCIVMPLPAECFCCHEFTLLEENMNLGECVTENTDFRIVCLNPVVLETSYISFLRYKRHRGRAPDVLTNRQSRLMAYRQFVCWVRKGQPLGKKHRITLQTCVVNVIKKEFPSLDGVYEGLKECESDTSDSE
ncbi:uncharacterized protein LOC134726687 [Mytilus trossulus]|uniref:uncharacterized protein LOC134726687 n=1 Tax=Mytilus trossulus TaxID=6551 RepID=UPI0030059099